MLKKLYQQWHFKTKTYNIFISQVQKCFSENKAIFLFEMEDETLFISSIFNEKMVVFTKSKHQPLSYKYFVLEKDIKDLLPQLNDLMTFQQRVLELKIKGEAVESQHIVEFLNNNLKNMTNYYTFSRKEIETIYKEVINNNISFFKANPPAIVLETSANKWID